MLPCPQTAKLYQRKYTSILNCTVRRGKKNANIGVLKGGYESCVSALTVGRFPVTLLFVVAIGCFGERRTMPFIFQTQTNPICACCNTSLNPNNANREPKQ